MAISLMQKIRLVLRGWSRRREEREKEFLQRNVGWGSGGQAIPPVQHVPATGQIASRPQSIDIEGLQAAYLDGSGLIAYYLDAESGEVMERRDETPVDATRYKRVPARGSEDADRRAFIETLEPSRTRQELMKNVASANFRSVLASDRTTERAWFNFRNARATAAIKAWLKTMSS